MVVLPLDDASGLVKSFEDSVRAVCATSTRPLSFLPRDHSVYRSFFLLDSPLGRVANSYLKGSSGSDDTIDLLPQ